VLLVVGNLSSAAEVVDVQLDLAAAGLAEGAAARLVPDDVPLAFSGGRIDVDVPAKDFRLIEIR
jgi:hypothetical protein